MFGFEENRKPGGTWKKISWTNKLNSRDIESGNQIRATATNRTIPFHQYSHTVFTRVAYTKDKALTESVQRLWNWTLVGCRRGNAFPVFWWRHENPVVRKTNTVVLVWDCAVAKDTAWLSSFLLDELLSLYRQKWKKGESRLIPCKERQKHLRPWKLGVKQV